MLYHSAIKRNTWPTDEISNSQPKLTTFLEFQPDIVNLRACKRLEVEEEFSNV